MAVGKSHVTSRHLHQIEDTAYDATIPALLSRAWGFRAICSNQASAWDHRGSNSMNLIPHVKGAKEAFGRLFARDERYDWVDRG